MKNISRHAEEPGIYPWPREISIHNLVIHLIGNVQDLNKHKYNIFLEGIKEVSNEQRNRELFLCP